MKYKKSQTNSKLTLAIVLFAASLISTFTMVSFSNSGQPFWVATADFAAGHQLSTGDMHLETLKLGSSSAQYLDKSRDPVGQMLSNNVKAGEILAVSKVSALGLGIAHSAVPLSIRGVDVATGVFAGDLVDIYWVLDTQNSEPAQDPILILGSVSVTNADSKNKNFGTDVAITVSVEETQVLRLLAATTQGRLVVVRSHV